MNAVDFFCGGGGMTKGLLNADINVVLGIDSNAACRMTYEENNEVPFLAQDVRELTAETLIADHPELGNADELFLVGCAPCQPFSSQRRVHYEHVSHNLLDEFGRMVEEFNPAHILFENVPGIQRAGAAVLQRFTNLLENLGYNYDMGVVNAKNYGVPQNRRRFVLIASRVFVPAIPPATHGNELLPYETVYNSIHHFPEVAAGEIDLNIPNHTASELSELNMERIQNTPHDGGDRRAWPERLVLACHQGEYTGHTDVYGRMAWTSVAPTLTSKCYSISNGRYGHPVQNRAITLREAASLQTFPVDYVFHGGKGEIGRQIGNAVPVLMAQVLGGYVLHEHNANQE